MNDEFDFGFTAVDEEELDNSKNVIENLQSDKELLNGELNHYKNNLESVRSMITPLLNNLMKNPEKDYIHWPDREEKIKAFIKKLDTYFEEY